jgi:hypothetical protein
MADSLDHVARAGLPLGADHGCALVNAAKRLPEVAAAAHERHLELVLVDVQLLVRRGEHLALVDVVDAHRLDDLRLDEVSDAALGHYGNRDRFHDGLDHGRVGHAGYATVRTDVSRHTLQGHDGNSAGLLRDARLLRVHDVHDYATFKHLRAVGHTRARQQRDVCGDNPCRRQVAKLRAQAPGWARCRSHRQGARRSLRKQWRDTYLRQPLLDGRRGGASRVDDSGRHRGSMGLSS